MQQKLPNQKVERDSNIELLRIVLMMMIIIYHIILNLTLPTAVSISVVGFTVIAVDCYVFISGYFGINFKIKTLISFIVQGIFYSAGIYLLFGLLSTSEPFSATAFIKHCLPLLYPQWWFYSAFICLYILSPIINKGVDKLNKIQLGSIILLLLYLTFSYVINNSFTYGADGRNFFGLLLVYLIARFCKKHIPTIKYSIPLYILILGATIGGLFFINNYWAGNITYRVVSYTAPWIIGAAVLFFYIFKKINLKSKAINRIATLTFGIYLIHESMPIKVLIREMLTPYISDDLSFLSIIAILVVAAACIFTICAIIEQIRQWICNPLVNKISRKIETKLTKIR